jgi:hypothetical protein
MSIAPAAVLGSSKTEHYAWSYSLSVGPPEPILELVFHQAYGHRSLRSPQPLRYLKVPMHSWIRVEGLHLGRIGAIFSFADDAGLVSSLCKDARAILISMCDSNLDAS